MNEDDEDLLQNLKQVDHGVDEVRQRVQALLAEPQDSSKAEDSKTDNIR